MTEFIRPKPVLEEVPVASLVPHDRNARTHSARQLSQIEDSIRRFDFLNPVLVDENSRIIAGHGRVAAAKSMGRKTVPVIRYEHMSEADKKAYIIADNRLAELAGWDNELLSLELGAILEEVPDFDLEVTGFVGAELEALLSAADEADAGDADAGFVVSDEPPVTSPGQMWVAGEHRIICGDARDADVYEKLLGEERAQMVFTDPPYNVPIDGHVCGLGKVKHAEFAMASGEMSLGEFTGFLTDTLEKLAFFSADGSIHYVCMDWRHMREVLAAGYAVYDELKNLIVWNKDNGGMGAFYRSKHELIFAFKKGTAKHINNFELGQYGRYRTNVWDYAGVNSLKADRAEELEMHPTVKPVKMVADAMRDCSKRGGTVLDAFGGSGTTLIAAEQTKRKARLIELDPRYVDVTIRRWQKLTGKDAVSAETGMTFSAYETMLD